MFCVIYRSSKRDQTYLYVEKKDDFSRVPEELMKGFGQPQLAMILPLDGRKKLVNADIEKVIVTRDYVEGKTTFPEIITKAKKPAV